MAKGNKGNGYSNPMQEHHKKARQKELQRNKLKRTKERDERALQTKTTKQVKEEIQKLEKDIKRHHHGQQQKTAAEHKLERLQKELKLLQKADADAKARADADAEAWRIANQYRQPQRPLTELDDPRKSIYYDKIMNPYGAPPPGKPRLYHRRYGGVTLNPHEAVVPGEEPPIPPPPLPPRDTRHTQQPHDRYAQGAPGHRQNQQRQQPRHHPSQRPNQNRHQAQDKQEVSSSHAQEPPRRQSLQMPSSKESQSNSTNVRANTDEKKEASDEASPQPVSTQEEEPPSQPAENDEVSQIRKETTPLIPKTSPPSVPSLPAPSQAVQRTLRVARNKKRGKVALADIWASTEEVEYERVTNLVDLEADDIGTTKVNNKKKKKKKKKKKPPLEFYYRDTAGNVQGPFSKVQMRGWIDAGYFPLTTKARTNRMDPDGWVPMGDLPALKEEPEESSKKSDNVQDRIATLKGTAKNDDDDEGTMDSSLQARIAAMRADLMASSTHAAQNNDNDNDHGLDSSMQARVAAMRADLAASSMPEASHDSAGNGESVKDRIAAPRDDDNTNADKYHDEAVDSSMKARIAAMRADLMVSSTPDDPNNSESNNDGVQDRIAALRANIIPNNTETDEVRNGDDVDLSVQARIATMKADLARPAVGVANQLQEEDESQTVGDESNSSLQDRIAALRQNAPPPALSYQQEHEEEQPAMDERSNTSLQDRIAALRKNDPPLLPLPPPAYPVDNEETTLQDRIAALRKNAPPPPPPPPPAYPVETTLQDRMAALRKNAPPPPPPPPPAYPVDDDGALGDENDVGGVTAYPAENEDSVGALAYPAIYPTAYPTTYPLDEGDEDEVNAYPLDVNGEDTVAPYPTDDAYPGAEDLAYPVIDSYPVEIYGDDRVQAPPSYEASGVAHPIHPEVRGVHVPPPKKSIKIDKALVSFVPTHLQKKKRKIEGETARKLLLSTKSENTKHHKKAKLPTQPITATGGSDENYEEFMDTIDVL